MRIPFLPCFMCDAIKSGTFPFTFGDPLENLSPYTLDSEDCIREGNISIYYCPVCGRKLSKTKAT
jgi:hypothetical protein